MRTSHNVRSVRDTQHHVSTLRRATGLHQDNPQDNRRHHQVLLAVDLQFLKIRLLPCLQSSTQQLRL